MRESDVVKSVVAYLQHPDQSYFVSEQFKTGEGKVDVAGFKWLNSYEIDSIAVECKPTNNPKAIMKWLLEQISSYQRYFPKVYLAVPEGGDAQTLLSICKASFVGYMSVSVNGKAKIEFEAPRISPSFDDFAYRSEVFQKAVIWLTFREVFGNDVSRPSVGSWISTRGDVQFNLYYDEPAITFSVNIEDARRVFVRADNRYLYEALKNAPSDALLWIAKEKYFGRGFRRGLTILWKCLHDITLEDADFILKAIKEGDANIHLQIYKNVWGKNEILKREEYINRINEAKEEFKNL